MIHPGFSRKGRNWEDLNKCKPHLLCALHTGTYCEMPLTTVSHWLWLAPTGCTYCEIYLRFSHFVWLVPPVFALRVDCTSCVRTQYGSHLLCPHSVWFAPTVSALRMVCTYCVCTPYGSHLLCSHSVWLALRMARTQYALNMGSCTYYGLYALNMGSRTYYGLYALNITKPGTECIDSY